ncbi:aspartic proteinase PCS1-like [Solanum dulcamara]|uniref:aspartic proteinase PCS1-like n=1 Tax=Solanum dulcamara TaxID=45834 RepID=UPI002485853E|nr:aspartic proteinase PCS1-like [Solanum dulcamara]
MGTYKAFLIFFLNFLHLSIGKKIQENNIISLSFPLTTTPLSQNSTLKSNYLLSSKAMTKIPSLNYKSNFKYSMALIVTLPIGTPPQDQQMVLDTGSQLSWIQCNKKLPKKSTPPTTFDPSLSSSFSVLPCNHPLCKPRIPDFTLPTSCDQNRLCHYSYFYADGTLAEGNLVREKITFSNSQTTPPLILGCATESRDAEGILGMNLGRYSFVSQAKVQKFSYCVPRKQGKIMPSGTFYLGQNPNSHMFQYINLLTFPQSQRMPNMDPLAYTIGMVGIKFGGKRLNISERVFRPDAGGSGQTMIDSGTQYTFLVEEAYNKVRDEIVRLVGPKLKKGYVYGESLDMCFDAINYIQAGQSIGDMTLEFENGVEILINKENMLDDVGRGVHCVGIGRSQSLGIASNIIGNFHQQNLWVEFDLSNRRVGFAKVECK